MGVPNPSIFVVCLKSACRSLVCSYRACSFSTTPRSSRASSAAHTLPAIVTAKAASHQTTVNVLLLVIGISYQQSAISGWRRAGALARATLRPLACTEQRVPRHWGMGGVSTPGLLGDRTRSWCFFPYRPSPPDHLAPSIPRRRAHDPLLLHPLDHPGRARIADPQPPLDQRGRGLAGREHQVLGLLVDLVLLLFLRNLLLLQGLQLFAVRRGGLEFHELHDPPHIFIRHERPVQPHQTAGAGGEVQHVPFAE